MEHETNIYTLLNECAKDRLKEQERLRHDINHIAKLEYSLFCAWCNAFKMLNILSRISKNMSKLKKNYRFG